MPRIAILIMILVVLCDGVADARVRPDDDSSALSASILRNIDAYDPHWGGSVGACWRGRVDLRLEARGDWIGWGELWMLQAEAALWKRRGFMLETGYWKELDSTRRWSRDLIPVRLSFPFDAMGPHRLVLHATAARFQDGADDLIGFVGLDFMREERWIFTVEMNVNQDFRYHFVDFRLTRWW